MSNIYPKKSPIIVHNFKQVYARKLYTTTYTPLSGFPCENNVLYKWVCKLQKINDLEL